MATMAVKVYTPQPNHGTVIAHHSLYCDLATGEQYTTLSRTYYCPCGEALLDGDPVVGSIHRNCYERGVRGVEA